jgi:hypothetical protein
MKRSYLWKGRKEGSVNLLYIYFGSRKREEGREGGR